MREKMDPTLSSNSQERFIRTVLQWAITAPRQLSTCPDCIKNIYIYMREYNKSKLKNTSNMFHHKIGNQPFLVYMAQRDTGLSRSIELRMVLDSKVTLSYHRYRFSCSTREQRSWRRRAAAARRAAAPWRNRRKRRRWFDPVATRIR